MPTSGCSEEPTQWPSSHRPSLRQPVTDSRYRICVAPEEGFEAGLSSLDCEHFEHRPRLRGPSVPSSTAALEVVLQRNGS